jgi:hypothetical protein
MGLVGSTDNGHTGQNGQEISSVNIFTLSAKTTFSLQKQHVVREGIFLFVKRFLRFGNLLYHFVAPYSGRMQEYADQLLELITVSSAIFL